MSSSAKRTPPAQNSGSEAANGYLKVAQDHAERGDWLGAGVNAAEAAKYFGVADKLAEVAKKRGGES